MMVKVCGWRNIASTPMPLVCVAFFIQKLSSPPLATPGINLETGSTRGTVRVQI